MRRKSKLVLLLGIVGAAVALAVLPAAGSSSNGNAPRVGSIGGIVPSLNNFTPSGDVLGSGDLTWHGGPVMHTNQTYAIYWDGGTFSFPTGYDTTINQFFSDVAADNGKATNVYGILNQYSDGSGHIQYNSTFEGSYADHQAYPSNGCSDPPETVCLTDAQLHTEIQRVVNLEGWPKSATAMYFLYTPSGVGSCFSNGGECAYSSYCAYHGSFSSGGGEIIYANQPYNDQSGCRSGTDYPNGQSNHADPTINVMSHEHNEAITDPNLNAWYDAAGYEIGDKCAWIFGTLQGPTGGMYNETINGHHYKLQEEYDNATHSCLQAPKASVTVTAVAPSSGSQGSQGLSLKVTGSNFVSGAKVTFGKGVKAMKKSVTFVNSGEIDLKVNIKATAKLGPRDVTVTNPNGGGSGTLSNGFTVTS